MKLLEKPFFRSGWFRLLLFLLTLLLALGALAAGIGLGYNMAFGSYGSDAPLAFTDSPICNSLMRRTVQNTADVIFGALNGAAQDTALVQTAVPHVTNTPPPLPALTPPPMLTQEPLYGMETDSPTQGAEPSAQTLPPLTTAPTVTEMPAPLAATPRVIDPYPVDDGAVLSSTDDGQDGYLLPLDDETREWMWERMTAQLAAAADGAIVYTLHDAYGNVLAVSDPDAADLRRNESWCKAVWLEKNRYGFYAWAGYYGSRFSDVLVSTRQAAEDPCRMPVILTASLRTVLPAADPFARAELLHHRMIDARAWLPAATAVLLFLAILCFGMLLAAAGRRRADTAFHRTVIDRLPTEIWLFGMTMAAGCTVDCLAESLNELRCGSGSTVFGTAAAVLCTIVLFSVAILLFMGMAVRIKTKTLWKNSVCAIGWRFIKRVWRFCAALLKNMRLLWKLLAILGAYLLFTLFAVSSNDGWAAVWLLVSAVGVLLAAGFVVQLDRLRNGAKRMRAGSLSEKIPTKGLYGACRDHAEDLNGLAEGLNGAVEQRIRSERMKTDLITNVSHDLKTPLTSIVNYVELLKGEDLGNETAKGYVEVLDRQAQRLKKLTVDIVDASKAQSGALNVCLAPTDLAELLRQCMAEYADRIAAVPLTPVLHAPESLMATADGRLLFRVLDNLLGNAAKYAMPNTRLYIDAEASADVVVLRLRNISREALNIPAEELTARFVRGDLSRATEGSGLGLSIAEDLMRLMGGTLHLRIDGDLFCAELRLPEAGK